MKNYLRTLIILSCLCILQFSSKAQTFEPRESTHRTRGLAEFGEQIVAFGTGLVWMDTNGKILDKQRIIDGAPSSDFFQGVSDNNGGLWLLSRKGLTHLNANKKAHTVFTSEEMNQGDLKDLKSMQDGSVFCLTRKAIIKITPELSYDIVYTNTSEEGLYFNHFDRANDGNFYIASYKEVFKLSPKGKISRYKAEGNPNFNDIQCTEDGRVIILDYRNLFEFKDEAIISFIPGDQIARGIKLYEAIFTRSDDFWLYGYQGNIFRNQKGTWKNYIPPAGLKTGNFGEYILKSSTGDIWMSLAGQTILKFNGLTWKRFDLDKKTAMPQLATASLENNTTLLSYDTKAKTIYREEAGEMLPWKKIKQEQSRYFKLDKQGELYWSCPDGIYTLKNGTEKKVVSGQKINHCYKIKDQYIYSQDNKIFLFKNGKSVAFENNEHFLGWERVSNAKFYRAFDDTMLASSTSRRGLVSIYDGNKWDKLIQVDGKKLKNLSQVFTFEDSSYLIFEDHQIVKYDASGWHWIDRTPLEQNIKYPKAQMSTDGSIWLFDINENITLIKNEEVSKIEMPLKEKGINPRAITKVKDKVYDIYMDGVVLRCSL